MPSVLFSLGYLLMVVVVSWLAYLSHIPEPYIYAIVVIMLGIGAASGFEHDRQRNSRY
jgi:NhaP-type Na+/H+ or K+/H+ antiporter